jgi:hypothetical protein
MKYFLQFCSRGRNHGDNVPTSKQVKRQFLTPDNDPISLSYILAVSNQRASSIGSINAHKRHQVAQTGGFESIES